MAWRRDSLLAFVAWSLVFAPLATLADVQVLEHHHHKHHHKQHGAGMEEMGCTDVAKLGPGDDKCAFVRQHCADPPGIINYPRIYYCGAGRHGPFVAGIMLAACTALLLLMFRIIARASDDFFSCILSQISQDLGLPPRLGGVTLLALGNGAPDLSASIEAVKSGEYQLAMGALTGAGMFVGAVVAGRIVTLSGGVRARGAQIRDISTQFITVAVVMGIVASGWFSYASVTALLSIYAAYVAVVAVADFTKRLGVEWGEVARSVSKRVSRRWRRVEMTAPLLREDHGSGYVSASATPPRSYSPGPGGPGWLPSTPEHAQLRHAGHSGQQAGQAGRSPLVQAPSAAIPAGLGASPLLSAASLPTDLEAGASQGPASGWLPPDAVGRQSASLPDLEAEGWRERQAQQQHGAPLSPNRRRQQRLVRHGPPVAHFHPRVTYGDIVQMSVKEYRQRALAEMAQSKSFFERRGGRVGVAGDSDGDSDYYSGEEGAAEYWEEADGGERYAEYHGQHHGQHHGQYQPPVVSLNSTLMAAQEAVAEYNAEQAAAAGGPGQRLPVAGHTAAGGGQGEFGRQRSNGSGGSSGASSHPHTANQQSSRSGSSNLRLSVTSFEMAPPAGPSPGVGAAAAGHGNAAAAAAEEAAEEAQGMLGTLMRAADAAHRPLVVLLQGTIPLVEANSYQRRWFLRSLAASPLFIVAFLQLFTWQALLCALCVGAVLAAAGYLGTQRLEGKAPLWTFGTGYPIGAALVAVYGFAVAAMWISVFASEIVGLLQFFGMLSKAEPAVLGVTVLAWGNSLMDYFNNTAMAGRSSGGNSMAMTACFAGPLFNMLVGLGLGFWALLQESHATRAAVTMDPVVLVGCLFIMLNCAGLVGVSLAHRQRLPAWCGWAMVACYAAYMASVLVVITVW